MPTTHRFALLAAAVPLLLTGCSGSSTAASHKASPSPSATPATQGALPIALSYVVTARKGISDADLKAALTKIAAMKGVAAASLLGGHRLRVDLGKEELPDNGKALLVELKSLGIVTVPS